MKNLVVFLVVVVSTLLVSCGKQIQVTGYVPENQTLITRWIENPIGSKTYHLDQKIMVKVGVDTIFAQLSCGTFLGSNFVKYKDTHPLYKGEKVYVRMIKKEGECYSIFQASLVPFE